MPIQHVQKIACINAAGFVMRFTIVVQNNDEGTDSTMGDSGDYPIDQTRVIDMSTFGFVEGANITLKPRVHAVWGATNDGNRRVAYAPNNATATYNVSGTTLNYDVELVGG